MLRPIVHHLHRAVPAVFVAAFLLLSSHGQAQTLFQPLTAPNTKSMTLPAGATPKGVAVADFNHDGFPDLAVANFADTSLNTTGTISVYLSNSSGALQAPVKYPTCGGPTAILAEDLDLTGLPDIAVTCNTPSSNVIQVFLNLGNGTFDPTMGDGLKNIVLGTGKGPVAITSGDFNSDGHPDLAVANSLGGSVTLFLSNPSNNFTYYTVQTITGLGTPTAVTSGRFTSSGNLDLAVTDSASQSVHILTGDGTGNFTLGTISPSTGITPNAIVAGDFNHDGFLDLAVANAGDGTVSVLLGKGNGSFTDTTPISVGPSTGMGASAIIAADILGNGRLDLLVGNTTQNSVAVLMNNGNGTFQSVENYAVPNGPAYLAVGDFNRDGKPDLAVTQSSGSAVSLLINNTLPTPEPGGLNFNTRGVGGGRGNMAVGVAVADFNHDGNPDIAAAYFEDNSVRVLAGKGNGHFGTAAVYPVGKQPYWVTAGDLNNDGYDDLVTANTTDGTISVLMNNGNGSGTFAAAKAYSVGKLPYQVAIGDLNGDGIADIAVTNYGDNTVTILYGPLNAPFQTIQSLQTCTNPYGVAIGDFRHTGQNDIAVTCYHTGQLEVFLNNGMLPYQAPLLPTTFQSPLMYSTGSFPTSLVIGDFNRDGNLDIVTGNSVANNVSFFGGVGDGTFNAAVNSFALNFPDSIAAGDVNGDGIPDIVTVAPNFNQIAILLGKGDGSFQPRTEFTSATQPWAVAVGDFNRDGKLDIVTANTFHRVNLTIPAYQTMYMNEFPPVAGGHPSLNVLLNASGTNITLTHSPSGTVPYGTPVTVTATVKPTLGTTTPTGSVIFEDTNGTPSGSVPLSDGTASLTVANPGSGKHQITVLYSGDTLYQPFTQTGPGFVFRVSGTAVALTVSPNPIPPNAAVSYSVTIGTAGANRKNPIGTITLYAMESNGSVVTVDGPNAVGTAGKGGITTFSKTLPGGIPAGNYYVYAVFTPTPGNTNPAGSSPQVFVVSQ